MPGPTENLKQRAGERSVFDGRILPGYVDFEEVDLSAEDYDPGRPFHLEIREAAAGTVVNVRPIASETDAAIAVAASGLLGAAGYGLILSAVKRNATVLSGASLVAWHLDG